MVTKISFEDLRKQALDTLGEFGDRGITVINELILLTVDSDVKSHGFGVIKKIKSQTDNNGSKRWQIEGEISGDDDY